jgi:hypothetical protein
LALTQHGYYLDHTPRDAWAPGWAEFGLGWITLFSGTLAWLGNPLLIASWVALCTRKRNWAAALAVLACLFMLSFLLNKRIIYSEAGSTARIAGYGLGYGLWVASAAAAAVGAWWARPASPPLPPAPAPSDPAP